MRERCRELSEDLAQLATELERRGEKMRAGAIGLVAMGLMRLVEWGYV